MAAAPVLSPLATSFRYQQLADYVAEKLGEQVKLVQGKTYAEINDLVKSGDATLALVCTNPYLEGREEFGMELRRLRSTATPCTIPCSSRVKACRLGPWLICAVSPSLLPIPSQTPGALPPCTS